ncbi:hypothetical protein BJX66DRAFT_297622, partial [Aspergillus keveii]
MDEEKVGSREVGGRPGQKERERARGVRCEQSRQVVDRSRWSTRGDRFVVTVRRSCPVSVLADKKRGALPGSTEGSKRTVQAQRTARATTTSPMEGAPVIS